MHYNATMILVREVLKYKKLLSRDDKLLRDKTPYKFCETRSRKDQIGGGGVYINDLIYGTRNKIKKLAYMYLVQYCVQRNYFSQQTIRLTNPIKRHKT